MAGLGALIFVALHVVVMGACVAHILLREHRQPESRAAWLILVAAVPYAGVVAYMLFGRTSVGRRRVERLTDAFRALPRPEGPVRSAVQDEYAPLFAVGHSISGYEPVGGNRAKLLDGSEAVIDAMVADIDAATDHVHLMFYIWLDDVSGRRVAEALMRAAGRGVACRALVDDLGSRHFLRSPLWAAMGEAGVQTRRALPVGNPLFRALLGRIDLRNHRKIFIVDNRVTYCGSQNCADAAFLPKAKYAPWVDSVVRFEGPVAAQAQHLFASDWVGNGGDDFTAALGPVAAVSEPGVRAQVIGSGPTFRTTAMPELFAALIYAARDELCVTTPYYVPSAAIHSALCAAANRGVATTLILPARNDSFAVGAASRSYYRDLIVAGVRLYEFEPGLLHAKTLTLDGRVSLIGSTNMDRRSFDLNYENNVLVDDAGLTEAIRTRQGDYLVQSRPVTLDTVDGWSTGRRIWNNALAIVSPVL
ncbi:MAG: cardiolipin synthase [Pseudomonadota bacterium]|nr:cardiolipin synthase [Pseudomonadota bacterium]